MKKIWVSILAFAAYIMMITVNSLANIIPFNQKTTGEISDAYPNLFTPAAVTFSIWGVIYLALFIYVIEQLRNSRHSKIYERDIPDITKVGFIITCVLNAFWLIAWHYDKIGLSMIIMIALLATLIYMNLQIRKMYAHESNVSIYEKREIFVHKIPFGLYLAWISIATCANIIVFLVSINWNRFHQSESFWTSFVILFGMILGVTGMLSYDSLSYGAVFVWAYLGIFMRHHDVDGFNEMYTGVIFSLLMSMLFLVCTAIFILFQRAQKNKSELL